MRTVKTLLFISLLVAAGCSTVDTQNGDSRPWDGPTKADLSKDWWFKPEYYHPESPGEYP
jgi:hypothetical protein